MRGDLTGNVRSGVGGHGVNSKTSPLASGEAAQYVARPSTTMVTLSAIAILIKGPGGTICPADYRLITKLIYTLSSNYIIYIII